MEGRRLTAEAAGCSMEPEDVGAERIDDEVSGCGRRCRRRGRRSTRGLRRGEQGEGGRIRDGASGIRPSPARRRLGRAGPGGGAPCSHGERHGRKEEGSGVSSSARRGCRLVGYCGHAGRKLDEEARARLETNGRWRRRPGAVVALPANNSCDPPGERCGEPGGRGEIARGV